MVKLCQLSTKLGLLSCWFASLFARDHIPLRGRVQPSVTNDQVEARHQIWQTFEIWWCRMLKKQPCPLEEPGVSAGQVHTHPIAMKWRMGGGTYHPINKPYEITAALLESSCVQSHQLENQVINFELRYLGIPPMNQLFRWTTFWKYCYLVATKLPISREWSKFQGCWKHLTTLWLYNFFNKTVIPGAGVNIRYHQIW